MRDDFLKLLFYKEDTGKRSRSNIIALKNIMVEGERRDIFLFDNSDVFLFNTRIEEQKIAGVKLEFFPKTYIEETNKRFEQIAHLKEFTAQKAFYMQYEDRALFRQWQNIFVVTLFIEKLVFVICLGSQGLRITHCAL